MTSWVCWVPHPAPWEEERLIGALDLPLNLAGNRHHAFAAQLSAIRSAPKARARAGEVVALSIINARESTLE